jgi:nucleotide-binding universal stress UspA family protein
VRVVLAGFDGTLLGAAAVAEAARSVGPKGTVFVVCAYQTPRHLFGRPQFGRRLDDARGAGRQVLDDLWSKHDALPRARLIPRLACGPPAEALARAAASCRADAIFVGARRAGRLRVMRGTFAQKLQRVATVPVIAVIEPRVAFPNSGFDPAEASEPEIPNLVSWW